MAGLLAKIVTFDRFKMYVKIAIHIKLNFHPKGTKNVYFKQRVRLLNPFGSFILFYMHFSIVWIEEIPA